MGTPPTQPGKGYRWHRYPWTKLRIRFITEPELSMAELCRQEGISQVQPLRRAKAENWKELRAAFVRELTTKAQGKVVAEIVDIARESATSLLAGLRRVRERVLEASEKDLANPRLPGAVMEQRETKFEGDPKTPTKKTVTRRVRAHHQGRGVETMLKVEAALLARLLVGAGGDEDKRVFLD